MLYKPLVYVNKKGPRPEDNSIGRVTMYQVKISNRFTIISNRMF